ncbi:Os09g0554101, partial [Oryza sativa Japonica Group]
SSPKRSIVRCDSADSSRGDAPSPSLLPCSSTAQQPGDGEKRRPRQPVREGVRLSSTLSSHLVLGAAALLVIDC